ncbi:hypothetical protein [Aliikangiella coralliicola]|uniref:Uncharacterized protein n=1 Tax=Aliikangiella coralliicola TaxID=2592383 RepID=A0A545UJB3_9GAMM|nr:hypothetical protein [Aliikangiella coralliicola]TQV89545.1 hypothetical protein FLL46_01285 [Aliikangiella coralliicola]
MKNKIHPVASIVATLCIASFFTMTVFVELFGSHEAIATVKSLIVMPGLFILIPALAITGGTGFARAKTRKGRLIDSKLKRMPFIAANGLLVLLPCAIFLNQWASSGLYDTRFYTVQVVELLAGAINLTLMSMNMRDGLVMTGKLRRKKLKTSPK